LPGDGRRGRLLRVDILNTIGVSIMLMGSMCWIVLWLIEDHEPACTGHNFNRRGFDDFPVDPTAVDKLASAMASLADRILY